PERGRIRGIATTCALSWRPQFQGIPEGAAAGVGKDDQEVNMKATELRNGLGVKIDGKLAVLTQVEHRTPGNLRAFIQIKYKDIQTGKSYEKRLGSADEIETVDLDRREMEYLYSDSS